MQLPRVSRIINFLTYIWIILNIAPDGRCGHLRDRGDFSDGETRVNVQMTSAKNSENLSPHVPKKSCSQRCTDWCLVSCYKVWTQSHEYCRLWIGMKTLSRAPTAPPEGSRELQLWTVVRTDVLYHPAQFQLNRISTVGCESFRRFQGARPHSAFCGKSKTLAPIGCADWLPSFSSFG